jgi:hypothetical protein
MRQGRQKREKREDIVLSSDTHIVAASDVLTGEFDTDAVILDLRDGVYYGLEGVGARIWSLLQRPTSLPALRDAIVAEYDVEAARCLADLRELCAELLRRGLIRAVDKDAE